MGRRNKKQGHGIRSSFLFGYEKGESTEYQSISQAARGSGGMQRGATQQHEGPSMPLILILGQWDASRSLQAGVAKQAIAKFVSETPNLRQCCKFTP